MKLQTKILRITLPHNVSDEKAKGLISHIEPALDHTINYLRAKLKDIDPNLKVELTE